MINYVPITVMLILLSFSRISILSGSREGMESAAGPSDPSDCDVHQL